jgi:two-component system phosphate regulon sensor histidine kinase PhoR
VKDALEVIAPQAASKQIRVVEQLTPVFYQTLADRDMLYQAVLNLMSNAVKYTSSGGQITVETTVDESRKKVIARITDTGVGIPPQDVPFVFDKFYSFEKSGRSDVALQYYGRALKLRPTDDLASRLMAGVNLND